jgi:hypothetical protein
MLSAAATLLLLAAACQATHSAHAATLSPNEDWNLAAEARALHQKWQQDPANKQCFAFSVDASIARDNFEYPDADTGERKTAKKGACLMQKARAELYQSRSDM